MIDAGVIADFRAPHYLRLGFTPLYLSADEVTQAATVLIEIIQQQRYQLPQYQQRHGAVTYALGKHNTIDYYRENRAVTAWLGLPLDDSKL
jgi:hypothetical protein